MAVILQVKRHFMNIKFDFNEHVIFIAGAGSGIGLACVHACLKAGAQVIATDINLRNLSELQSERLSVAELDVTDSKAVMHVLTDQAKQYGRIDAAILASGFQNRVLIDQMSDQEWGSQVNINLNGIFYLTRTLFPIMKAQKKGSIVTFTSGLATNGWPGAAAYGAAKAGIIGLVKSAAQELKPFGVCINAVSPGITRTPLFLDSASAEEISMYEKSLGISPPEGVVPLLLFLISDAAGTISGNVIERRLIPQASE
jgi:NAD(P)-dependent dehydrogenase (short-subunit alcohol dehydrogenase family)